MAEIELDFGVNVGDYQHGSTATIKKQLDSIVSRLPVFNINVRISDESIKGVKDQIESIKQQLSTVEIPSIKINTGNVSTNTDSVQNSLQNQAEIKNSISELTQSAEGAKTTFSDLRASIIGDLDAIKQSISDTFTTTVLDEFTSKVAEIKSVMATASTTTTSSTTSTATSQKTQETKEQTQATKEATQAETALGQAIKETSQAKSESAKRTKVKTDEQREEEKAIKDALAATNLLYKTEEQLHKLFKENTNANDLTNYNRLVETFEKITEVAAGVRSGVLSIDEAFSKLKASGPEYLQGIRTLMAGLQAEIEVTGSGGTFKPKEIYNLIGQLQDIKKANTNLAGKNSTYDTLMKDLEAMQGVMVKFEAEVKEGVASADSLKYHFEQIGIYGKPSIEEINTSIAKLRTEIKDIVKETTVVVEDPIRTLEQVKGKIASLTTTLETAKNKNKGIISTEEFTKVQSYLDTFNQTVNRVETAKLKGEVLSLKDAFIQLDTTLEQTVHESNIAVSELRVAMTQIEKADTPLNKLQTQLENLQRQRDKSGNISGTEKYTNLAVITKQFEDALKLVENEGLRVDEAIAKVGLDVETAFNQAKSAIGAAKLELYNFNKEMTNSGVTEETLRKSLINMKSLQFRGDNVAEAKASQEYNTLAETIGKVETALNLVTTKSLDVDRALKAVGLDGSTYMEQISTTTSKFNLVLIDTTNEAKKAEAALKEQQAAVKEEQAAIKEEDALVKSVYSNIKNMTSVMKQASGKGLSEGIDYSRLEIYLNLLNRLRTAYETGDGGTMSNAFKSLGGDVQALPQIFKEAELAVLQLKIAITETNTETKQEKTTTLSLLDAYKLLAKAKSTVMNNEVFKDEASYKAIVSNMDLLQTAVTKVEGGCANLDTAFKEMGKDGAQAVEQINLKMAELNNVMIMPDSKMALSTAVSKQTTLDNLISGAKNVNTEEYKQAEQIAIRLAEAIRLVRTEGTGINTVAQAFAKLNEEEGKVKLSAEAIALAIADLKRVSGGNDLETKIMSAYKAMSKLKSQAEEYINIANSGKVTGFTTGNLTEGNMYSQFLTQFQTVENVINAIAQGGTVADNVLKNLAGSETQLFASITSLSAQMQAELKKLSVAYKEAEANARAEGQAERSRQTELRRANTLLNSMTKAQEKWTAAATGKTSYEYKNIEGYVSNLKTLINEFNSGSIDQGKFAERVREIGQAFQQTSNIIAQAGENTVSFTSRISSVVQRFGAWFGIRNTLFAVSE